MKKPALALTGLLLVLFAGVLASACGSGSPPGVATLSGNTTTSTTAGTSGSGTSGSGTPSSGTKARDGLAYTKCMRAHGVKNFPDPSSNGQTGGAVRITSKSGIDPNSPTFQAAQKACQSILPKPSPAQIQKAKQRALALSKCMRQHGVTNFPDPTFSANGTGISIKGSSGSLDPNSPTFKAAQKACQAILHLPAGPGKQAVHL